MRRVARLVDAGEGELAPLLHARSIPDAKAALDRGASLLVADSLPFVSDRTWTHPDATWALSFVLEECEAPEDAPIVGEGSRVHPSAVLGPRVVLGARVVIGAGCVIGHPGFGWAMRGAEVRAVPQLGGVIVEDDVHVGPLSTIDAGTLSPTRVRRGAKIDAHCHIGHNADVGEGTIIAAQSGLAGSVTIGRGVLVGGQVGIADHVTIGDGARLAAKSGVIGDVPAGSVVAGYPALPRLRWLRGLAKLYKTRR